jgi:hypothetical protein
MTLALALAEPGCSDHDVRLAHAHVALVREGLEDAADAWKDLLEERTQS